jgi:tetratricopeptide (TPR) repeat protein
MRHLLFRKIITHLAVILVLSWEFAPSISYCQEADPGEFAKTSVVVHAQSDGVSDELSEDIAAALREALPHIQPVHIISPNITENVLSYYGSELEPGPQQNSAAEFLARAKEHYFGFQYNEALAEVKKAVEILSNGGISENGALLHDALLTQAIIARAANDKELAGKSLEHAVRLNPFYRIDRLAFPPSVVELYEDAHSSLLKNGKGIIKVETNPPAAEIYINGIIQGVSPFEFTNVPGGSYSILIKTNRYKAIEKEVRIAAGQEISINEKLKWEGGRTISNKKQGKTEGAKAQIAEGIRIAELLKADKAVMVDCDETKGAGQVSIRMIDRRYRASHKPLLVKYAGEQEKPQAIADAASVLAEQIKADIAGNPAKYLDIEGIGDPVLLGKRKREFHRQPFFWGAIGTLTAGALAGGLAAALSGSGSSPDTGTLAVQFK